MIDDSELLRRFVRERSAAGIASFEVDEHARNTAFFIYAVCFGAGLVFALLSVLFGHLGHTGDVGLDHGSWTKTPLHLRLSC